MDRDAVWLDLDGTLSRLTLPPPESEP